MAILLVKISDERSLALNEFYDYCGCCYASTRSREKMDGKVIDMSSFYDAAINTKSLRDIPVVFVSNEESASVFGWYKKAEIFSEMQTPSLFLQGNIKAYATDCLWIPKKGQSYKVKCFLKDQLYEVIEEEDQRFLFLKQLMGNYCGNNQMIRYHSAIPYTIPQAMQKIEICKTVCEKWANLVSAEECRDIRDIKTLEVYAKKMCEKDRKNPDGYYYLALACYQLGFIKEGLKQINKALQLERGASDLMALKGLLLVSKGHIDSAAECLHDAFMKSQYEGYLLLEGRAYMVGGKMDKAYECFSKIKDQNMLDESGIQMKAIEDKWSSLKYGYLKIKEMFKKREKDSDK